MTKTTSVFVFTLVKGNTLYDNNYDYQRAAVLGNPSPGKYLFCREVYVDQGREVRHDTASAPDDVLHFVEYEYDSLGRLSGETNGLGVFGYTYNAGNNTGKVDAIAYPNGMTAAYDYYPVTGTSNDARLKEIHNTANGGATLSKFTYEYDPAGPIHEWQQQLGTTTAALQAYTFGYTRDNELRDATLRDNTGAVIEERSWQYDLVGNRLRQSLGGSSTYWHYNDLNQIEREGGAGTTLVEGTVDEPAIVEVDVNSGGYQRAVVLSNPGAGNFLFRREVEVDQGLNTIDVRAEDASGNISPIKNYELTLPSIAKTYEHDLNGNLLYERDAGGNVLREFRWDAQNRLTHVIEGANETEFEYDGLDRRIRITESVGGVVQNETTYLWADGVILQRRAADEETIKRNYYWSGFSEGSSDYFYTRDHLGSVREVIASDGTTIESRYDYDLWGNVTRTAGMGVESDFRYTGHFYHATSDLHLAQFRAYDPELGRWLSRDPAGFIDGPNLYAYVGNDPVGRVDLYGLDWLDTASDLSAGFADTISFGATDWIREKIGVNDAVDKCSSGYGWGQKSGNTFDMFNPKGWLKGGYKVGIKNWSPDIFKKLKQFSKLPIKKQKDRYKELKKTYNDHLKKYNQTPGKTTGETNRMERELREMEDILRNRGVDPSDL